MTATSDPAPEVPAAPRRSFARRHWGKLAVAALAGLPVVVQLGRSALALAFTYSSGDRVGYVQKLSRKGWVCKTWEGELQLSSIPGSAPVVFLFTVRGDSLARAIQALAGRPVALTFEQHPGIPLSCFGDTEYFIVGVRTLGSMPEGPAVVPPPAPVRP